MHGQVLTEEEDIKWFLGQINPLTQEDVDQGTPLKLVVWYLKYEHF